MAEKCHCLVQHRRLIVCFFGVIGRCCFALSRLEHLYSIYKATLSNGLGCGVESTMRLSPFVAVCLSAIWPTGELTGMHFEASLPDAFCS